MKKLLFLVLICALLLPGCGDGNTANRNGGQSSSVDSVLKEKTEQEKVSDKIVITPVITADPYEADEPVDVDLTTMSSTMVYSEVYNIVTQPNEYLGKKIKMKGLFDDYYDEPSGNRYFSCVIQDATACCAQGIEFIPEGLTYPDGFPAQGSEICVIGTFDVYVEGEYMYCTLRDAKIL